MTVIAWDGKTLAADKRVTYSGLHRTVTKIFRVRDALVAVSGNGALAETMLQWYRDGCDVEKFPAMQRDKDEWIGMLVVNRAGVFSYERTPHPLKLEDTTAAMGSGRDYAIAAMHCGKTAREAVEIACIFDISCGNGIDTLEFA